MPVIINELDVVVSEPTAPATAPEAAAGDGRPPLTALDLLDLVERDRERRQRLEAD